MCDDVVLSDSGMALTLSRSKVTRTSPNCKVIGVDGIGNHAVRRADFRTRSGIGGRSAERHGILGLEDHDVVGRLGGLVLA